MEGDEVGYSYGPAVGPATEPLDFPPPLIERGRRDTFLCFNHEKQQMEQISNVLIRDELPENVHQAYWPIKKKIDTVMGHVEECVVLERYHRHSNSNGILFQTTDKLIAIKVQYIEKINRQSEYAENPLNEIAAMQLIGSSHPNVLGCLEVLNDGWNVNVVMDYCAGGDLVDLVHEHPRGVDDAYGEPLFGIPEDKCRKLFRDIVKGMRHLNRVGICHRDLSPENIILYNDGDNDDDDYSCKIIDFGLSLLIPHSNPGDPENVIDSSQGTVPRLITPQSQCGKLPYMTPEIYRNKAPFDGGAADVWTAGTILLFMLTGQKPYEHPDASIDQRFYWIKRDLKHLLESSLVDLSEDGYNFLRGMLRANFRMRLTLSEIENHPWLSHDNE